MADRSGAASARNPFDEPALVAQSDFRGVLAIRPFRSIWMALAASSLGNWLGLFALTALVAARSDGVVAANFAIGGLLLLKLLPALVLGPFAGVLADRLNRRWTMVTGDLVRASLMLSIAFVHEWWWVYVATVLIECASLFWIPAKEATIPNLVPRERLEAANQLNLLGTYGSAPVAAALFAGLALLASAITQIPGLRSIDALTVALCVNSLTFFTSGVTIARIAGLPERAKRASDQPRGGLWASLIEGWRYVGTNRTIRGLVGGIIGAFAAGGVVIGLAKTYVTGLGAGDPGYGLLVGSVFSGLALGMLVAPRLLVGFSRRRMFGLSIVGLGMLLICLGVIHNIVIVSMLSLVLGGFAGMAWVTGYTLLGLEVADEVRGRTFAFVQNTVQLTLIAVLAAGPFLAGAIGSHQFKLSETVTYSYSGAAAAMLLAGLLALTVGFVSYRTMDDRRGMPLLKDLFAAFRGQSDFETDLRRGLFLAFEGGEGAGKSTQAELLATWLRERGHEVVLTHEPGATSIGESLRAILLDHRDEPPTPRAEALLYAADRAQHVDSVVRPALEAGSDVITDRYLDSSIAYQAAGRHMSTREIAQLSIWATSGLRPDLTVLLDVVPSTGLARFGTEPDRLESESLEFHERVRAAFQAQARRAPERYLVIDAQLPVATIHQMITERVAPVVLARREASASGGDESGEPGPAFEAALESLVTPDGPSHRRARDEPLEPDSPEESDRPDVILRGGSPL